MRLTIVSTLVDAIDRQRQQHNRQEDDDISPPVRKNVMFQRCQEAHFCFVPPDPFLSWRLFKADQWNSENVIVNPTVRTAM